MKKLVKVSILLLSFGVFLSSCRDENKNNDTKNIEGVEVDKDAEMEVSDDGKKIKIEDDQKEVKIKKDDQGNVEKVKVDGENVEKKIKKEDGKTVKRKVDYDN